MEILFELIAELVFEGSTWISSNRKISKWIRYPLILLIFVFITSVIFLIFVTGVLSFKKNKVLGIFFFIIGVLMLIGTIRKFRK